MKRSSVYEPQQDFYIDQSRKMDVENMNTFHMHQLYEIYYLTEGSRKYFIDDSIHLVNAGSLVLINANAIHKTASMGEMPYSRIVLNFSDKLLNHFSSELQALDLTSVFKTKFTVLPLSFKYKLLVEGILSKLIEFNSELDPSTPASKYREITNCLLLSELLIYIKEYIEILEQKAYDSHQLVNNKVDKIIKYIGKHYQEDLSLTSIAEQFYISPFYLSKIFKRSTNLSIIEYINSLRIRQAKELLETSSYKISDIAEIVGFSSSSHFSRTFKIITHLSPQQYKKFYHS